jgi:hypothetical protein
MMFFFIPPIVSTVVLLLKIVSIVIFVVVEVLTLTQLPKLHHPQLYKTKMYNPHLAYW